MSHFTSPRSKTIVTLVLALLLAAGLSAPGETLAQGLTPPLPFVGLAPCRLVDTRGNGFGGPFGPPALANGVARDFPLAGQCGIPADALAVSLNVTAVDADGPGFLMLGPAGGALATVSTLNYLAGQTVANAALAPLGPGGLTVVAGVSGTDLILDVNGYFVDAGSSAGGDITAVTAGAGLTGGGTSGAVTLGVAPGGITGAMLGPNAVDGSKIADGSIGAADVNLGQVQARVAGTCDPGSAIRVIDASGAVTCQPDTNSGGTVTSVGSGLGLLGGPITGAGTLSVDTAAIQARVTETCSGSAIRQVNADGTVTCQPLWTLTGNAGTTPGTHFLGTTDSTALELRVNSLRVWRLEPGPPAFAVGGPNVIGGFQGNNVTAGVGGATIAGGGADLSTLMFCVNFPCPNRVTDSFGTVGGGINNQAGDGAGSISDRLFATVGGGRSNTASGARAAVGGGGFNTASGADATVPGGFLNQAGGVNSFAAGRQAKVRDATQSGDADGDQGTFVWADAQNADFVSTGPNQFLVRAAGGVGINTNSPAGELQLGSADDTTAFRFGNAGARNHLIANRDMVFNAFGAGNIFLWRQNVSKFDESSFSTLMRLNPSGLEVFGDLTVSGNVSKGGGSFKIDHPLDPLNRYLSHSFVESPDMKNIYDGVVTTDREGFATVELPEWFEALNRDFRYQLTVIGSGAWARARVVQEVRDHRFVIQTDVPGTRVSWQVTGIRHDPYARWHPIVVEEMKPAEAQGRYLHPEAYGARAAGQITTQP